MNCLTQKYIIKIPANISLYCCTINNILIFINVSTKKILKLKTKVIIDHKKKLIKVTRHPLSTVSTNEKKKLKAIQATQIKLLKQMLLDILLFSCKKLKLVGVGFRVANIISFDIELLQFKLGFSHSIFFKIPKNLKVFCSKGNKFFIISNSYFFVTQIAALIRSFKMPEPYKGKGILYTREKISLKEGKKI